MTESSETVIIKKYANRRLYDTSASKYVTLDHLRELVKSDTNFKVIDAKSGEDLTRSVLGQIIFEQEAKGENMLPVEFLRQVISFYGDSMQTFVPSYLRLSMENLAQQQNELRESVNGTMGPAAGMAMIEEQTKRNMAMFDQAMKMFSPFGQPPATPGQTRPAEDKSEVESLRAELDAMKAKLDKLAE